jgi:hypothetical protein
LLLTLASALVNENRRAEAEQVLERATASQPDWLEGQYRLAELRWTAGDTRGFARGYANAVALQPMNLKLRLAWFRFVAQTRDWSQARALLADSVGALGELPVLKIAQAVVAAESGASEEAEGLFEQTRELADDVRGLAWIRHCLRNGRPADAQSEAMRMVGTPSAGAVWPYLSLIWRLMKDDRAIWLDGSPPYIQSFDSGLTMGELTELAELLRLLHTARAPYIEQSVRGGTQTERPLFFRNEPIIQKVRLRMLDAVRAFAAGLPARDPSHPLLSPPRNHFLFSGSWSVRLLRQGFNVAHTHPLGWISSAFYVSLPSAAQMGAPPAGWLRFGEAPPELGIALPAYSMVEPRAGRVVLFPSTMWHATTPFADGERLTIAFDVRAPRQ